MTKQKSNSVITTEVNAAAGIIKFNVLGAGVLEFDLSKVSPKNREFAALHGFK